MADFLLTQIINYGAPFFGFLLFLGALGIPVGASVLLIAAGAFAQQGFLVWQPTAAFGLFGALLGDALSFGLGYYAREAVEIRFGGSSAWKSAQSAFDSRAGLAVFLTRFLVTALAVPINLIAASSGMRFRHFMTYDVLGETTWILLYGGLGYWFGSQWEVVSDFISNFGGLMLGLVFLLGGIVLSLRGLRSKNAPDEQPEPRVERR